MSVRSVESLRKYVRRLCDEAVQPDDSALLKQFVSSNDREAFELLIARHGPMVLGTANRLVNDPHDAEDVFQAVFLSLARLAKTIRQASALPAWLYKTTCRIAAKARKTHLNQLQSLPEPCQKTQSDSGLEWREIRIALDEELQRLPERLRSPLLLCYLSGLTRDEAAKQLGWSLGTLKRRLEEGRKALRTKLEKRGIAAVGLALTVMAPEALQASVSKPLLESSLSLIFANGTLAPASISVLVLSSAVTMKGLAMKATFALLAAVGLGVGLYAAMGQAEPLKKTDEKKEESKRTDVAKGESSDDPLPKGSTLRFGTSRFRLGLPIESIAISRDGKMAVAANGGQWPRKAGLFDLASGSMLYEFAPAYGWMEAVAISPDGRTIATKHDFSVWIRDTESGGPSRKFALTRSDSYSTNGVLDFTPDGKAIAVTSQGAVIHLIDFESGKIIRDISNTTPDNSGWDSILGIAFSHDGKLLATGGFNNEKGVYFARLWEVETGKELRRFIHAKNSYGISSLAFSPDAKLLATRSHDGRLRLFDVDSGKQRKTFPADGGGRKPGAVAFSPDSKTVAAAGDSIRLHDVTTGEERLRIDQRQATGLQFTDGGKTLTGAVKGAIYKWDTATGKALTPESAGDSVIEQILVTADGRSIITRGQEGEAHIWDAANGKHLKALTVAWQHGIAMSPDGRFLVWPITDDKVKFTDPREPGTIYDGTRLRLYDIAADKLVDRFPGFKGNADDLTFTAEGKTLVTVDHRDGMMRFWNFETGKEERSIKAVPQAEKNQSHYAARTVFSPDVKMLAVAYHPDEGRGRFPPHVARLFDVASGKELHQLDGHRNYLLDMAFSPDGRLLVTAGEKVTEWSKDGVSTQIGQVFVWDTATGKRVTALPDGLPIGATAIAFSPEGRFLATALPEGLIQIWEVATWSMQNEFKGRQGRPTTLTFTPGGQLLSGSVDTTVLAWDIRPRAANSGSLEMAWTDLARQESAQAFKAEGRFLAAPADTVKLLADRIKLEEAVDAKQIEQWIADLDSDEFAVRDAASKKLSDLGNQVKPFLEATAKNAKSAEAQDRAKKILERLQTAAPTPQQLRQMRAVHVLELIGDPDSKDLLKKWAEGPAAARLTQDASTALKRLR